MNESIELQRIYSYVKRSLILMNADENLLLTSALFYSPLFSRFFFFFFVKSEFLCPSICKWERWKGCLFSACFVKSTIGAFIVLSQ